MLAPLPEVERLARSCSAGGVQSAIGSMETARKRTGLSVGSRVVLAGLLLTAMVLVPVFWRPGGEGPPKLDGPQLAALDKPSPPPAAAQKPADKAVPVEAAEVQKGPLTEQVTAVGSLRSDESITLRPEVAGRISAIQFREGERVAKGAPLVKLDPSVTQAELQQAGGAHLQSRLLSQVRATLGAFR